MSILGKLSLDAIPLHEPILIVTFSAIVLGGLALAFFLIKYNLLGILWNNWLTSIDHKRLGVMYIVLALIMLLRGFSDAIMMRLQLAIATNGDPGYLPPHHYDQVFTAHGVIMIIFMAMPFMIGLMNIIVPLQIGARDVAYPFLNNLSFWLTAGGAILINVSLFVGEFAKTGWVAYPPLAGLEFSPDVGVDYYIWALQISGIGTTLTAVNFLVTVFKMRAPGMKLMDMPIFTWTCTWANILIAASFPILTAVLAMLTLDRYLDFHFFTNDGGGNSMMYINLFWAWGHPEKLFNWLFTMYRGRLRVTVPVLWTLGFMVTFTIGGMTGVLLAVPGADYVLHNSLFLIAHFHNTIIGGAVFGYLAGFAFWFPKVMGFHLNVKLGKAAFWCWLIGFFMAFMPLYVLGFLGMTRRLNHTDNPDWNIWLYIALVGAFIIMAGIICQLLQLYVSFRDRHQNMDTTGDPWNGHTLEWSTASPPQYYNFANIPTISDIDAFTDMKEKGEAYVRHDHYEAIHMPKNTASGMLISGCITLMGFALIWHIWWLAALGLLGAFVCLVLRAYTKDVDYYVQPDEVALIENAHLDSVAKG